MALEQQARGAHDEKQAQPPVRRFRSPHGRTFTVGIETKENVPALWSVAYPVFYKGKPAGFFFVEETIRAPEHRSREPKGKKLLWSGSLNALRWSVPGFMSAGIDGGYDVFARDTIEECAKAWEHNADEILNWAEARSKKAAGGGGASTKCHDVGRSEAYRANRMATTKAAHHRSPRGPWLLDAIRRTARPMAAAIGEDVTVDARRVPEFTSKTVLKLYFVVPALGMNEYRNGFLEVDHRGAWPVRIAYGHGPTVLTAHDDEELESALRRAFAGTYARGLVATMRRLIAEGYR